MAALQENHKAQCILDESKKVLTGVAGGVVHGRHAGALLTGGILKHGVEQVVCEGKLLWHGLQTMR